MQLPEDPPLWLEVLPDSRVRLAMVKVEMGQGVHTSIAQIAVEELGISWDDLVVVQADTSSDLADSFGTGGSFRWQPAMGRCAVRPRACAVCCKRRRRRR